MSDLLIGNTQMDKVELLEKKLSSMMNAINTLAMSMSETVQKNSEIGMHLASLLRTIQDGKPLTAENLSESSVLNMVDKIDGHIKTALERKFLVPSDKIEGNSIVCLKQLDANGQEVNRKLLMNLYEQDNSIRELFIGRRIADTVSGSLDETKNIYNFVVLEVYQPTEALTEEVK